MKVIRTSDVDAEPVAMEGADGVTMQVLLGQEDGAPTFTLRLFQLDAGGHTPRHAHGHEHEVIITGGNGTLWSEAQEHDLKPGVVALVAPNEKHQFRAGPTGLAFYCIVPHVGHG